MTPTPSGWTIGQISINVHDLKRAIAFYRDILAVPFLFEVPPTMAFFNCGGVRLMLAVAERPEFDHPASILYYKVERILDVHRDLLAKDVHFESEPRMIARMPDHELWMAFFRDSENNLCALMSEQPAAS